MAAKIKFSIKPEKGSGCDAHQLDAVMKLFALMIQRGVDRGAEITITEGKKGGLTLEALIHEMPVQIPCEDAQRLQDLLTQMTEKSPDLAYEALEIVRFAKMLR